MDTNTVVLLICACISSAIALVSSIKWISESARADRAEQREKKARFVCKVMGQYMVIMDCPIPRFHLDAVKEAFIAAGGPDSDFELNIPTEEDCA